MAEEFVPSEPIGDTDEPNSPISDELPGDDSVMASTGDTYCVAGGKKYANYAEACDSNHRYRCVNGTWHKVGEGCPPGSKLF